MKKSNFIAMMIVMLITIFVWRKMEHKKPVTLSGNINDTVPNLNISAYINRENVEDINLCYLMEDYL